MCPYRRYFGGWSGERQRRLDLAKEALVRQPHAIVIHPLGQLCQLCKPALGMGWKEQYTGG